MRKRLEASCVYVAFTLFGLTLLAMLLRQWGWVGWLMDLALVLMLIANLFIWTSKE